MKNKGDFMSRTINFKGNPLALEGTEIKAGDNCPSFTVTGLDMADITNESLKGKVVAISLVPSVDTPTCSIETKRFNEEFKKLAPQATCLTISMDLPFAQKRWCAAEGVENITIASDYKHRTVGSAFGAWIKDLGLLTRAVFVCDKNGKVTFAHYVPEVSEEPDYAPVLAAVKAAI